MLFIEVLQVKLNDLKIKELNNKHLVEINSLKKDLEVLNSSINLKVENEKIKLQQELNLLKQKDNLNDCLFLFIFDDFFFFFLGWWSLGFLFLSCGLCQKRRECLDCKVRGLTRIVWLQTL